MRERVPPLSLCPGSPGRAPRAPLRSGRASPQPRLHPRPQRSPRRPLRAAAGDGSGPGGAEREEGEGGRASHSFRGQAKVCLLPSSLPSLQAGRRRCVPRGVSPGIVSSLEAGQDLTEFVHLSNIRDFKTKGCCTGDMGSLGAAPQAGAGQWVEEILTLGDTLCARPMIRSPLSNSGGA